MCWPLSSSAACGTGTLRARPPACAAMSNSATRCPRSDACPAAARPAHPAPTTATCLHVAVTSMAAPLRAGGNPQLAQRRQRGALVQHLEAVFLDLVKQRAVDVGHH